MKTSTVNGVKYELPDGWEPMESVPFGERIQVMYTNGESCPVTFDACFNPYQHGKSKRIAWQHIVAPKVASWKPKQGEVYWSVIYSTHKISMETWSCSCDDGARYAVGNCYPTREAAEAARERIIGAHTGGAKWKGGV